ncbi:MAG: tRNA lysidine(34) synthetase TilS [Treponema sp.]|nr:tRNA lysidine(34) synthetase TilS [Treponema sp.]
MRDKTTQNLQTITRSPLQTLHSADLISRFENKILSVLKNYSKETIFLAAVSGGADSMAMLVSLRALSEQPDFNYKIVVFHVEHGIRPAEESRGDADFVRDFCERNGIDFRVKNIRQGKIASLARSKGIGIEAAARYFRHKALFKSAAALGKNTVILLAHTKDDLLETTLMRILRGAGPAGLAAMRENAEAEVYGGQCGINVKRICRPLLAAGRIDVIDYLNAKNIFWREDSSNADEKFLRNRIRRRLVPLLNESFPSWKTGAASLAETQSLAADFIVNEAQLRIIWETINLETLTPLSISTNEENFFLQPQIIREEALFIGINKFSCSRSQDKYQNSSIKRSVIRRFCAGELKSADLGSVRIKREKGEILITRMRKDFFECGVSRLIKA